MIFPEAYKVMRDGYCVRRSGWEYAEEYDDYLYIKNGKVYAHRQSYRDMEVRFIVMEDAIAYDWVVAQKKGE